MTCRGFPASIVRQVQYEPEIGVEVIRSSVHVYCDSDNWIFCAALVANKKS